MRKVLRMDELPPDMAVLIEACMILAEGRVMADGKGVLKRWRRACEWLIKRRDVKPESAVVVRGVFAEGTKRRS